MVFSINKCVVSNLGVNLQLLFETAMKKAEKKSGKVLFLHPTALI
jgi:hypothetical protein